MAHGCLPVVVHSGFILHTHIMALCCNPVCIVYIYTFYRFNVILCYKYFMQMTVNDFRRKCA